MREYIIPLTLLLIAECQHVKAGDLVSDKAGQIEDCEKRLSLQLAVHKKITDPREWIADCPGGGVGETSDNINVQIFKNRFVSLGSLGNPANWIIEGAEMPRVRDSGGPSFSGPGFDSTKVWGSASCSHGSFGGGITGSFRLAAKLVDLMSDLRAEHIARSCAALVLHPGVP